MIFESLREQHQHTLKERGIPVPKKEGAVQEKKTKGVTSAAQKRVKPKNNLG